MMSKHQTIRNAIFTIVQVAASAVFLFTVYRFLLAAIGPKRLGVWSIVMALSTLTRITDLGFAGGMARFVAKYLALDQRKTASELVETGAISLLALVGLMLLAAYPLVGMGLPLVFEPEAVQDAQQLLPYSMASLGLLAVAGVFLSSLDGLQRADLRNIVLILGTAVYGVSIFLFVQDRGFLGLGLAQIIQSVFVLLTSWIVLRRQIGASCWFPSRWRRDRFKEMIAYNIHLQFSTFASFLGDPLTKLFLGHYGGLGMVGYYEMANKMVSQFRAIVVNVNQVLVPVIAHLKEKNEGALRELYAGTYTLLFLVSITFYGGVCVLLPFISKVWLGELNFYFLTTAWVMLLAMQVNTVSGAAYFSNMGTGRVSINSVAQVIIGATNLALGILLGAIFGGPGVISAYGIAIVAGSLFLLVGFVRAEGLPLASLLPPTVRTHLAFTLLTSVSCAVVSTNTQYLKPAMQVAVMVGGFVVILVSAVARVPFAQVVPFLKGRVVG
jgi:O-antigen/teichoic acid export membrane protein